MHAEEQSEVHLDGNASFADNSAGESGGEKQYVVHLGFGSELVITITADGILTCEKKICMVYYKGLNCPNSQPVHSGCSFPALEHALHNLGYVLPKTNEQRSCAFGSVVL